MECLICKNKSFEEFLKCDDYFLSGESFTILQCTNCSFKITDPKPDKNKISSYYKSKDYISHTDSKKGIVNNIYQIVRKYNVRKKYRLIKKYTLGKSILDIGCGTGDLLNFFKEKKWNTFGIEPDVSARNIANKKGVDVYPEDKLNCFSDNQFDVITLWHVLEHVYDIQERINEINRLLCKNGILVVALPNCKSWDAKYYKEFWAAWDMPRHLYHFDKETVRLLFKENDFELITIKSMKFDSYYVSMLSEKYKNGKQNLLKAFYYGFKSNVAAIKNKEYSSLIYIFKKK